MILHVPVSVGEYCDKLTILAIKAKRIEDPGKREQVLREMSSLHAVRPALSPEVIGMMTALSAVNEQLWDVEDDIRDFEKRQDFGSQFVETARSVYRLNDRRASIKQRINHESGSYLSEQKEYGS